MLTAITNVEIYAPDLLPDSTVVVFDKTSIKYVGSALPEEYAAELIIDGTGCSLIPGLIDSHVHITMDPDPDPWPKLQESDAMIVLRGSRNALTTLRSGFTTLRDMGAKNHVDIALRNAIRQGLVPGPRLLVSGRCLCMTGGHGWMMGREVDSPDEARKGAREQLKATADIIKIMATGGVMTPGVEPGAAQLTYEEMAAAVAEAVKAGKKTATHAQGATGIRNAVLAGISSVEHGFYLTEEICALMRERGTYLVATLAAPHWIIEHGEAAGIPAWAVDKAKRSSEAHIESFRLAMREGVPIAMGTDAGTPFNVHGKNAFELELMVRYGMPPADALASATTRAADLLGLTDVGAIAPGMAPDMVLIDGNPVQDIRLLQTSIRTVIKNGTIIT